MNNFNYSNDKERKEYEEKKPCHCETKCEHRCFKVVKETSWYPVDCPFDDKKKEEEKPCHDDKKECDYDKEYDDCKEDKREEKKHDDKDCDKHDDDRHDDDKDRKECCPRRCCCRCFRF